MAAVVQTMQLPPTPTDTLLQHVPGPSTVPSLPNSFSTAPVSDELRELRVSFPRRPLPSPPTTAQQHHRKHAISTSAQHYTAVSTHALLVSPNQGQGHHHRSTRSSFYAHMRSTGLATISAKPRILACLLEYLTWNDFHVLCTTSRSIRRIFLDPTVKDVVFGHFIPGYRRALSLRDKRVWEDTIKMDYADLGLLMVAMETPLHRYPMHAISMLSTDLQEPPTVEQLETTKHLQSLCQVHSRTVLLLQNMVHSTMHPVASELDDPRWKSPIVSPSTSIRELTFPAPLSYFDSSASSSSSDGQKSRSPSEDMRTPYSEESRESESSSPSRRSNSKLEAPTAKSDLKPSNTLTRSLVGRRGHQRKWGSESSTGRSGRASTVGYPMRSASTGPSSWNPAGAGNGRRGSRRLSIFGASASPLPPPAPEPASMRYYSGSWRRVTRSGSQMHGLAMASDDEGVLKPPNRRFLGSSNLSSQSSLNSSPTQSSNTSGSGQAVATPSSSSPHDLVAATGRTRAPILRVFVPCSSLSEDVVAACEDQLIEDGLWDHLSVGDIVCNFGFVPPIEETEDAPGQQGPEKDHRRWLIYNGEQLLIYYPNQPPPISDPLSLPSPFYYTHILPPLLNPRFRLTVPSFKAHYSLAPLTNTISSSSVSPSASPRMSLGNNGFVRVKTYAWLATLEARLDSRLIEEGWLMNEGWTGEWVLQGEGTREGRVALQEVLRTEKGVLRRQEREYEIVLDKSGSGRLWLRMIDTAPRAHSPDITDLDSSIQHRTPP